MTMGKRIKLFFIAWKWDFVDAVFYLKCLIWNKYLWRGWCGLYLRKNEFHYSYNLDGQAILAMSRVEQEKYVRWVCQRRKIAHERDLIL